MEALLMLQLDDIYTSAGVDATEKIITEKINYRKEKYVTNAIYDKHKIRCE